MKFDNMKNIPCPLCKSTKYKIIFKSTLTKADTNSKLVSKTLLNTLDNSRKHGRYVRCLACGLLFVNPPDNIEMLLNGYKKVEDPIYLKTEKYRKILSLDHIKTIEKYKKSGNLLDIGCFAGFFLQIAQKRKWRTNGIEPSLWARKIAKERKVKLIGTTIESSKLKKEYYDVISMWDVIEHLEDPNKTIYLIHKSLKKNGILAIGTPNIDSLIAKIMGAKFPYLVRMHTILFSPVTLKILLEQNNFEIIHQKNYGRTFPIQYILERILPSKYSQKLESNKLLNFILGKTITLNIGDSFMVLAQKK